MFKIFVIEYLLVVFPEPVSATKITVEKLSTA